MTVGTGRALLGVILVAAVACDSAESNPFRTDKEPIHRRIPGVEPVESCKWKAGRFGEDSPFDGLGPSGYWITGTFVPGIGKIPELPDAVPAKAPDDLPPGIDAAGCEWVTSKSLDGTWSQDKYQSSFAVCMKRRLVFFRTVWE